MPFMTRIFSLATGAALAMSVGLASAATIAANESTSEEFTFASLAAQPGPGNGNGNGAGAGNPDAPGLANARQRTDGQRGRNPVVPDHNDLSPIPLPAAGWLLLAALGGLGLIGRMRKTA